VRDRTFVLSSVVGLTVLCLIGSVTLAVAGPSPPTPYSQQLLTVLSSLTVTGFSTVLGLLAQRHGGHPPPSSGGSGEKRRNAGAGSALVTEQQAPSTDGD
jgi:hypothetical protein